MTLEFIIGRDNYQKVKLSDNLTGTYQVTDLTEVTKVEYIIGDLLISSESHPEVFSWGGTSGEILLKIGSIPNLTEGIYESDIIIYRPTEPNGIQWRPSFKTRLI